MRCLGIGMKGMFYAEMVTELPTFSANSEGRILYCANDQGIYFGTKSGWQPVFPTVGGIKSANICWDWDFQLQIPQCVNSKVIPSKFGGNIQSLQTSLDDTYSALVKIKDGSYFADGFVKRRHIDTVSTESFTAAYLPIENKDNCFGYNTHTKPITVEEALSMLCNRRADTIRLSRKKNFGVCIGSSADTVETALDDLEDYLCHLKAEKIECSFFPLDDLGPCCDYNVQQALDMINWKFMNLKIVDLTDLYGRNYGECKQVLKTCGQFPDKDCTQPCGSSNDTSHIYWGYINADEVMCQVPCYPNIENVQDALNKIMCLDIDCMPNIKTITDAIYEALCNGRGYLYYKYASIKATGPTDQNVDCSAWFNHAKSKFPNISDSDFYCWAVLTMEDIPVFANGPYTSSSAPASLCDYAFVRYKAKFVNYDNSSKNINIHFGPTSDVGNITNSRTFPGGNEITYSTYTFSVIGIHIFGGIRNKNLYVG